MKPMFLPAVESERRPSAYLDAIDAMRANSQEYPQIWHLFALPSGSHRSTSRASRRRSCADPSPLSPGMRELIAAFTSYRNDCPF